MIASSISLLVVHFNLLSSIIYSLIRKHKVPKKVLQRIAYFSLSLKSSFRVTQAAVCITSLAPSLAPPPAADLTVRRKKDAHISMKKHVERMARWIKSNTHLPLPSAEVSVFVNMLWIHHRVKLVEWNIFVLIICFTTATLRVGREKNVIVSILSSSAAFECVSHRFIVMSMLCASIRRTNYIASGIALSMGQSSRLRCTIQ